MMIYCVIRINASLICHPTVFKIYNKMAAPLDTLGINYLFLLRYSIQMTPAMSTSRISILSFMSK